MKLTTIKNKPNVVSPIPVNIVLVVIFECLIKGYNFRLPTVRSWPVRSNRPAPARFQPMLASLVPRQEYIDRAPHGAAEALRLHSINHA
jgi:hypothetical protein